MPRKKIKKKDTGQRKETILIIRINWYALCFARDFPSNNKAAKCQKNLEGKKNLVDNVFEWIREKKREERRTERPDLCSICGEK